VVKVFCNSRIDDYVHKILLGDVVTIENGNLSKSISKTLQDIRRVCELVLGKDHEKRTVFFMLNPPSNVNRFRLNFGGSIFSISWDEEEYVKEV
jgi:hypothetical protein